MTEFSSTFYSYKRATLLFAAIVLIFCLPGANIQALSVAGVSLSGVSFEVLLFFLLSAATYYALLFGLKAYDEAKSNLIAIDSNENGLRRVLERSLDRHLAATQNLGPVLASYAARFDKEPALSELAEVRKIVSDGKIEVTLNEVAVPVIGMSKMSPSLFNLASVQMTALERKAAHLKQLSLHELKAEIIEAAKEDFPRLVQIGAAHAVEQIWPNREKFLTVAIEKMSEFTTSFQRDLKNYEDNLSSYSAALNSALFEVRILKNVRAVRFWFLEVGVVALLFIVAVAHYVGRSHPWLPSPFE